MQEVKLSNGDVVKINDVITRKTQKKYNAILYADTSTDSSGKINMSFAKIDDANEALVLEMIEGKKEQGWIDNLPEPDFQKLLEICNSNKKTEEVKKK